jgi:hypothetical protein
MKLKQGRTMPLTPEQFETLPDFVKSDYIEHEGAYVPQAELKVKGLKSSLDNLDAKYKDIEARMTASDQNKAAEIEAAKQKALEDARSKGDVKAIEERYQQQMADLEKRVAERTRDEVTKELSQKQASTKAAGIAETIAAATGKSAAATKALNKLLADRVKVDPETGKEYFLDDNGGALSVNRAEFEKLLVDEFPDLVKANIVTNGAGGFNGNNGGGAPDNANNAKADEARKKGDVNGFLKATLNLNGV